MKANDSFSKKDHLKMKALHPPRYYYGVLSMGHAKRGQLIRGTEINQYIKNKSFLAEVIILSSLYWGGQFIRHLNQYC